MKKFFVSFSLLLLLAVPAFAEDPAPVIPADYTQALSNIELLLEGQIVALAVAGAVGALLLVGGAFALGRK